MAGRSPRATRGGSPIARLPQALLEAVLQNVVDRGEIFPYFVVSKEWNEVISQLPLRLKVKPLDSFPAAAFAAEMAAFSNVTCVTTKEAYLDGLAEILETPQGRRWCQKLTKLEEFMCEEDLCVSEAAASAFASVTSASLIGAEEAQVPTWLPRLPKLEKLSLLGFRAPVAFTLPVSLKVLHLLDLDITTLPDSIGALVHLEELLIVDAVVDEETQQPRVPITLPETLGLLADLKKLTIRDSNIETLPTSLTDLQSLETLRLTNCHRLRLDLTYPGYLETSLQDIRVVPGGRAVYWPYEHQPRGLDRCLGLQTLALNCRSIVELPLNLESQRRLRSLKLELGDLHELPKAITQHPRLQELILFAGGGLTALPDDLAGPGNASLVSLGLFCPGLLELPSGFGSSGKLQELAISGDNEKHGSQIPELPGSVLGHLGNLQSLLVNSTMLRTLPADSAHHLTSLRNLWFSGWVGNPGELERFLASLPALQTFFFKCQAQPALPRTLATRPTVAPTQGELHVRRAQLCDCNMEPEASTQATAIMNAWGATTLTADADPGIALPVVELPESIFEGWGMYTDLDIAFKSVPRLPDSLGSLTTLRRLTLCNMRQLAELPASLGNLEGLQYLLLDRLVRLESLPPTLASLTQLTVLGILGCEGLREFHPCSSWRSLRSMVVKNCPSLECSSRVDWDLPSLVHLELDCSLCKPNAVNLAALRKLERFKMCCHIPYEGRQENPPKHQHVLPNSLGLPPSLRKLDLMEASVVDIDSFVAELPKLVSLDFGRTCILYSYPVDVLDHLAVPAWQRKQLQDDIPRRAGRTRMRVPRLPSSSRFFPNVRSLHLDGFDGASLPPALAEYTKLEELKIEKCPNLETLPAALGALKSLKSVEIAECPKFKEFPEEINDLEELHSVVVKGGHAIDSMPQLTRMMDMGRLEIEGVVSFVRLK